MIPVLIEAALRAMLVALTVWAGLRLFRVSNVPAQKTAWGLVLICAVAMPLVMRWELLPASFTMRLPASFLRANADAVPIRDIQPATENEAIEEKAAPVRMHAKLAAAPVAAKSKGLPKLDVVQFDAPVIVAPAVTPAVISQPQQETFLSRARGLAGMIDIHQLERIAGFLYLAVCAVLLFRIAYGLDKALKLWQSAEVFVPYPQDDPGYGLHMRFSRAVSSPVTIGSGVLLPYECLEWDAEKLRMVLAHERAHVRQGDFYLQLLAGLYAAVFWFSPLGWWLMDKLSDLGEAMSDRAGLEEAANRASYAQVLLEFAAMPRPAQMNLSRIGVAMARSRNLSDRIERLLNESSFRQAFAGTRRRVFLAVVLVPVALFAATALVRVEAAQAVQAPAPAAAPTPAAAPSPDALPQPAAAPNPPSAPIAAQAPTAMELRPGGPADLAAPAAPQSSAILALSSDQVPAAAAPAAPEMPPPPVAPLMLSRNGNMVLIQNGKVLTFEKSNANHALIMANAATLKAEEARALAQEYASSDSHSSGSGRGYSYSYSRNGDTWVLVTDPSDRVRFSGDWHDSTRESINKVRKLTGGKFLWFEHDGKSYFIDDPSIVGQVEAMYKPMEELGRKQEELGKKQEELGKQQEELGNKQEQASIPTPDISKEMAKLNEAVAKLDAKKGSTVSQEEVASLEERLSEIQERLGELQGQVGERQGQLGELQGKLGEQQGKLGEEQGKLGEEQGRIAEQANGKIKSMILDSLHNGKAKPVE
jgi:hypothetical protein